MNKTAIRLLSILLAAVMLSTLVCFASEEPTGEPIAPDAEEVIPGEPAAEETPAGEAEEVPAEVPASDVDGEAAYLTLPENEAFTVRSDGGEDAVCFRFVPSETTSYSVFLDPVEVPAESVGDRRWYASVRVLDGDGAEHEIVSAYVGPDSTSYLTGDTLRYVPMTAGRTYVLRFRLDTPGDYSIRAVSFADQVSAAERAGAPLLTEGAEVHTEFDGTYMSGVVRFVPEASASYTFGTGWGMYKVIVGEEGVFFSGGHPDDSSVSARLMAGRTYLLYLYGYGNAAVGADVRADRAQETVFAPVEYREADLAAGPLRYTVLILQDNVTMLEGLAAAEREAAIRLCEALADAPGTSYVAIVDMHDRNVIFPGGYGWDPYSQTDSFFLSDIDTLRGLIGYVDGSGNSKADLSEALDYAGGLLDAVRATYGDAAETNIILCSAADNTVGPKYDPGRFSGDPRANGTWANASCLNATLWNGEYVKSGGHPIYTLSFSTRGHYAFGSFTPLPDEETELLDDFMRELSSGEGFYYRIREDEDLVPAMETIAERITGVAPTPPTPVSVQAGRLIAAGKTLAAAEKLQELVGIRR